MALQTGWEGLARIDVEKSSSHHLSQNATAGEKLLLSPHVLLILQLIIVALRGILGEVLHELPIVAFGIVEVPALAVRM